MKIETQRHMLPRSTALSMTAAAALTVMAAAAMPAQADPVLSIGLQEAGVNGGAITPVNGLVGAYGTFSHIDAFGLANPANITPFPTEPLLQGGTIEVSSEPGTLVVWLTTAGNLIGPGGGPPVKAFESSFTQNLLPSGWTVQVDTFLDPADGLFTTAIHGSRTLGFGRRRYAAEPEPLRRGLRTRTRAFFAAGMGSQPAAWSFISSRRPLQHPPHVPEVDPSRMAHGLRRRRHERLRSVLHHLASAHGGRDKSTLSRDRARVASAHARSSVSVAAQRTVSRRVGRQIFCARRPRHARARAR